MINNDRIPRKSRVISARSGRRANCCVAAGLLTGATELSVRLGTIRAISPPFGASLKHSPTTFHTPLLPRCDHYRLFPLFNPNVRKWCEKLECRIYYSFIIHRIRGETFKIDYELFGHRTPCVHVMIRLMNRRRKERWSCLSRIMWSKNQD